MWEVCLRAGCLHVSDLGRYDLMGNIDISNQSTNAYGDSPEHGKQCLHSQEAYQVSCEGQLSKGAHDLLFLFSNLRRGEGRFSRLQVSYFFLDSKAKKTASA